ncbi:MAG: DUF4249 family protein [Bacteroidota bacterium]
MRLAPLLLGLAGLLSACDSFEPVRFEERYVVEAYLEAGESLPRIRLSTTMPIEAQYDVSEASVQNAEMWIHLLGEDGVIEETIRYNEIRSAEMYSPVGTHTVQPLRRYRLEVIAADGIRLTSETTVPATFDVLEASTDTLVFLGQDQLALRVSPSKFPGRQSIYILTTESLEPTFENLTPTYRSLVENDVVALEDLALGSSPLFNEANYDQVAGGAIVIRLPWLAVPFFGPIQVNINAIDDNLYDFYRSQSIQQGGGTLPPGEIPGVINHIEGGAGIFGSYATASYSLIVVPL